MKRLLGAAVLGCGLAFSAAAANEAASVPESGPLPRPTMQRLLLLDAERVGSRIVAVGDRGYVVYSDDQGKTWIRAQAAPAPLLTAVDFLDDQVGLAVGHDSVILISRDRGESWRQVFSAPSEQRPLLDVVFLDAEHAIAIGAYGAYYESGDGGKSWQGRKVIADDKHLNAIVEAGGGRLVILGESGTILVSPDLGKTWSPVASPYKGSLFGGLVADDGTLVAFGLRGRIFRSTDKGATWSPVENASVAALMGGDKLPDGGLVIAGAAGTALLSRDNGRSFVPIDTGTTRALGKAILGGANEVLFLGEAGVRAVAVPSAPRRAP